MFVPDEVRKISYASSFGVGQIPWYQKRRTANFLKRLDYISMRENRGSEIVKELTGLDVAEKIRETDKAVIIAFLTSHQEFAPNGYEVNAFRYLLKGQPEQMYIKQLRSIFNEYHQTHMAFSVQMSNTVFNVAVSDILYFEIFKRTIVLHTRINKYQFNGKLSEIEKDERLVNFVKPHKSYYVNLSGLKKQLCKRE